MPVIGRGSASAALPPVVARRVAGNLSSSSTSWIAVDSGGGIDLVIPARAGDTLEVGAAGLWGNEATHVRLDFMTMVGGSPVNSITSRAAGPDNAYFGNEGWLGVLSAFTPISGSLPYTVQSGDVSNGTVTLRPYRKQDSAVSKVLYAQSTDPFTVWARNLTYVVTTTPATTPFLAYAELFSGTSATISKSDTSKTAIDGTNLKLDFIWPLSGAVMFEFTGQFTFGRDAYFYLATAAAPAVPLKYLAFRTSTFGSGHLNLRGKLTGTPGAAASLVVGWEGGSGTTSTLVHGADGQGPITFSATTLP